MSDGNQSLTEKEKETLRLLVRGYDTKTIARHFQLSVHTINERLRNARQKMAVSSSREAARKLLEDEGGDRNFLADKFFGEANSTNDPLTILGPNDGHGSRINLAPIIKGIFIMLIILAALTLSPFSPVATSPAVLLNTETEQTKSSANANESDAVKSARQWLALVDGKKWNESWNATGQSFKDLNTIKTWEMVAKKVQPPLGPVVSRRFKVQEFVPAPPLGYEMVKFQTHFKNKPDTTETLTLVREADVLKVVGYWID